MLFLVLLQHATVSIANNLTISNVVFGEKNETDQTIKVRFDIAWQNSWRLNFGQSNWDAAWLFVKYKLSAEDYWRHASLNYSDGTGSGDGHTVPTGGVIESSNDDGSNHAHGVFLYAKEGFAQGTVSYTSVELLWDYGDDGVPNGDEVEIAVYGLEMVYVPDGAFYVGGEYGGAQTADGFVTSGGDGNFYIDSETDPITVGNSSGNLYYNNVGGYAGDLSGPVPSTFPKGVSGFYCMKYEITQGEYTSFVNTLTSADRSDRVNGNNGENRYTIADSGDGTYEATAPYLACNYLYWDDLTAYLDWAALRPITELEFEKACRGTSEPVFNEYAWGNGFVASSTYTISNEGESNESITANYATADGNALYASTRTSDWGPLRGGIFAGNDDNTGRVTAGSTYYGIMEMSGNVYETCISIGSADGRAFTGNHGNGTLASGSISDVTGWPTVSGVGERGGAIDKDNTKLRICNREFANRAGALDNAYRYIGGRGVRTAN